MSGKGNLPERKTETLVGDYAQIEVIDEKEKTGNVVRILPGKPADPPCGSQYRPGSGYFRGKRTES